MRTVDDYLGLITSQHRLKPKFVDTVSLCVAPFAQIQEILTGFQEDFDVDVAIGKQLDAVGEWVGVSRELKTPLTGVYFTWDGLVSEGWDSGTWKGPFDPDSGLVSLPDSDYRILIKTKIAANSWDGTIPEAYRVWETVFVDSAILIQDNQDMSMTVGIAGAQLSSVTQALLVGGYIPLKPMGVRVNYYAVAPVDGPLFAWDSNNDTLAGWDTGSWGKILTP